MSVSAGIGGTGVVGAVVGGAGVDPTSVARTLPFTGASHLADLVAIAVVLLVAGLLAVGLVRRRASDGASP